MCIEVVMTELVHNASESGVIIQCSHMCNKGEEFQYLWKLRTFGYQHLEPLPLHDNQVRTTMEKELGININMTNESCHNVSTRRFYLNISGMNPVLQHATVSCGVMEDSSTEVYSKHNGFIIITEHTHSPFSAQRAAMASTNTPTTETTRTEVIKKLDGKKSTHIQTLIAK